MSVFTNISREELSLWLEQYDLGRLHVHEGIASGIENTNYFVTTDAGRFVLTVFEKLTAPELPYFLDLVGHLAAAGVPCPGPVARRDGGTLGELKGKPACLAPCLPGRSVERASAAQCAVIGATLARMHLAGRTYPAARDNPRYESWWNEAGPKLMAFLSAGDRERLSAELAHQAAVDLADLPAGPIHADLFRDNALFDGDRLGGVIDFYFACSGSFAYDLAITLNDWCAADEDGLDLEKAAALMAAYHAVRPLAEAERAVWPSILRRAALRFWVSRLEDLHFPRPGEMTFAKDPGHFARLLAWHAGHAAEVCACWPSGQQAVAEAAP